jgi:hypothetical protein
MTAPIENTMMSRAVAPRDQDHGQDRGPGRPLVPTPACARAFPRPQSPDHDHPAPHAHALDLNHLPHAPERTRSHLELRNRLLLPNPSSPTTAPASSSTATPSPSRRSGYPPTGASSLLRLQMPPSRSGMPRRARTWIHCLVTWLV